MNPFIKTTEETCQGKKPYDTKKQANRAKKALRNKHGPLRAYKCEHCNKWHLTRRLETINWEAVGAARR